MLHEAQNERLTKLIASLGMSENEFSRQTGLAYNYLFQFRKFQGTLTETTLGKIKAMMPNLNIGWLRFGNGDVTTDGQPLVVRDKEFVGGGAPSASVEGDNASGEAASCRTVNVADALRDLSMSGGSSSSVSERGLMSDYHRLVCERETSVNALVECIMKLLDRNSQLQDRIMQQQELIAKLQQRSSDAQQ